MALYLSPTLPFFVDRPTFTNEASYEELFYDWSKRLTILLDLVGNGAFITPVHLSGGVGALAAYLALHPNKKASIAYFLAQGELSIEPWFTPPGYSVSCGETAVRNLKMGLDYLHAMGVEASLPLLPQGPAHPGQLPQILQEFEINGAALYTPAADFFEAIDNAQSCCVWRGDDESELNLRYLTGYADEYHAHLGTRPMLRTLLCAEKREGAGTDEWHPASEVETHDTSLAELTHLWPSRIPIVYYSDETPGAKSGHGSAYPHLQRLQWRARHHLLQWAEPTATAAWIHGSAYPKTFLDQAWQHVFSAHNLISGGAEGLRRLLNHAEQGKNLATAITDDLLTAPRLVNSEPQPTGELCLLVANPSGWARDEIVTAEAAWPEGAAHLQLSCADGTAVPYQLCRSSQNNDGRFLISFPVKDLPAVGFRKYRLTAAENKPYFLGESIAAGNTLENRFLRVTVKPNGALRIEDKRSGKTYDNCNVFEDGADAGTDLSYRCPEQDRVTTTYGAHAQLSIMENGIFLGTVKVEHELSLPADVFGKRSEPIAPCKIASYVTLRRNSPRIEIYTTVQSTAHGHRLRALFATDATADTCRAGRPFSMKAHNVEQHEKDYLQGAGTMPMTDFVDLSGRHFGLMVAARGLEEFALKPTPAGTLALTLFRAVREDSLTADEACPDLLEFDYALIPHSGDWETAVREAYNFVHPPRGFLSPVIAEAEEGPPETESSLVSLHPAPLLLSAVKRSEDGTAMVVRAYNPTGKRIRGIIECGFPIKKAFQAHMDETTQKQLAVQGGRKVTFTCAPHKIMTFLLFPEQ